MGLVKMDPRKLKLEVSERMVERLDLRPKVRASRKALDRIERLQSEDIARAIAYLVTRPRHVAVNEILIRPTEQGF